jgi:hypothetical protein
MILNSRCVQAGVQLHGACAQMVIAILALHNAISFAADWVELRYPQTHLFLLEALLAAGFRTGFGHLLVFSTSRTGMAMGNVARETVTEGIHWLWRIPTFRMVGHFGLPVHFVASPHLHCRLKCCPEPQHPCDASYMSGHVLHLCNLYCLSQPLPSLSCLCTSHSITRFPAPSPTSPPDSHLLS